MDLPAPGFYIKWVIKETGDSEFTRPVPIQIQATPDNARIAVTGLLPTTPIGVVGYPFIDEDIPVVVAA